MTDWIWGRGGGESDLLGQVVPFTGVGAVEERVWGAIGCVLFKTCEV